MKRHSENVTRKP